MQIVPSSTPSTSPSPPECIGSKGAWVSTEVPRFQIAVKEAQAVEVSGIFHLVYQIQEYLIHVFDVDFLKLTRGRVNM